MKSKYFIIVLISTLLLSACAWTSRGKINRNLESASYLANKNSYSSSYCDSLDYLKGALAIAQAKGSTGLQAKVLQAYVDNYNKIIINLKYIHAQSSINDIWQKGESYACWMPEMHRVMPLMTAEMKAQIHPESYPSTAYEQKGRDLAGEAFYQLAQKEKNKTVKLHDLLATYRYSPGRKGLNHDLQTAYENATNHIILKNAGDRAIAGKDVLREGVIPGLRHYYAEKSLDERKKEASDRNKVLPYPLEVSCMCHYVFDYPNAPQKTGTNFVITLRLTKAKRESGSYRRTAPEEREGVTQQCYDVPVFSRDGKGKKMKTGETKTRCVNSTYTYTENAVYSGTEYTTTLRGKIMMSMNGRTILKNQDIIGYESTESSSADSLAKAQNDIVRLMAYKIKVGIFSAK